MDWLTSIPFAVQLAVVALLLVVDSGLLAGMLVPSGTVLAVVAASASDSPGLLAVTAAVAAAASVAGACLGFCHSRHRTAFPHPKDRVGRFLHRRLAVATATATRRLRQAPVLAAAAGQCVAGARCVTPRLAAQTGIPLRRMLAGTIPAAVLWATTITSGGAVTGAAISFVAEHGHLVLGPPTYMLAAAGLLAAVKVRCWGPASAPVPRPPAEPVPFPVP